VFWWMCLTRLTAGEEANRCLGGPRCSGWVGLRGGRADDRSEGLGDAQVVGGKPNGDAVIGRVELVEGAWRAISGERLPIEAGGSRACGSLERP